MRIANTVNDSIVDGHGLRFTIFTQGCPHHCPGCHNPDTHDPAGGREVSLEELVAESGPIPATFLSTCGTVGTRTGLPCWPRPTCWWTVPFWPRRSPMSSIFGGAETSA